MWTYAWGGGGGGVLKFNWKYFCVYERQPRIFLYGGTQEI